ncbi:laccase domain-containing protein [Patescibacteria group bacterium]|nr:MAG: laccase domain-containing protein [Patescibacteria group bacterium]
MRVFSDISWLRAALSERADGNLRIGPDTPAAEKEKRESGRRTFLIQAGISGSLFTPFLTHSNRAGVVSDLPRPDLSKQSERAESFSATAQHYYIQDADALITSAKGAAIGVTVADCAPVFLADEKKKAIGAVHAGWRGLTTGILENTIAALEQAFGSAPADLRAWIGPCIGLCHFEVGGEVFEIFPPEVRRRTAAGLFVDLPLACRNALIFSGLLPEKITIDGNCTYCARDRFFSWRRDKPEDIQAMLAALAIAG